MEMLFYFLCMQIQKYNSDNGIINLHAITLHESYIFFLLTRILLVVKKL